MSKKDVNLDALARQGSTINVNGWKLRVQGDRSRAVYEMGSEGLVHLAIDEKHDTRYRIKCFWDPTPERLRRSKSLTHLQLVELAKPIADALGGAPFAVLPSLSPSTPFALLMKDVRGTSWKNLREHAESDSEYPPSGWPSLEVRAVWSYGLATAVKKMEARAFIHSDLSPGNVMVTPAGRDAGDMALVDFDEFSHPPYDSPTQGFRGSRGYAAAEIWQMQKIFPASDRVAMAILIQEFLLIGDPTVSKEEAFGWSYDQDAEIVSRKAEAHPFLTKRYPTLAKLMVDTLQAPNPQMRPAPEAWRIALSELLEKKGTGAALGNLVVEPVVSSFPPVAFSSNQKLLDLSATQFHIRASLERNSNGSVDIVVHPGAQLNVRVLNASKWEAFGSTQRVSARHDLIVFDPKGSATVRLRET